MNITACGAEVFDPAAYARDRSVHAYTHAADVVLSVFCPSLAQKAVLWVDVDTYTDVA